jgi:hypothetical protein
MRNNDIAVARNILHDLIRPPYGKMMLGKNKNIPLQRELKNRGIRAAFDLRKDSGFMKSGSCVFDQKRFVTGRTARL